MGVNEHGDYVTYSNTDTDQQSADRRSSYRPEAVVSEAYWLVIL